MQTKLQEHVCAHVMNTRNRFVSNDCRILSYNQGIPAYPELAMFPGKGGGKWQVSVVATLWIRYQPEGHEEPVHYPPEPVHPMPAAARAHAGAPAAPDAAAPAHDGAPAVAPTTPSEAFAPAARPATDEEDSDKAPEQK